MRKETVFTLLTILLINCSITAEKEVIRPKFIVDNEQILTENQDDSLNTLFKNHETETTNQIVLVTTADYGKHAKIIDFATEFGNFHGIGQREKRIMEL